MTVYESLSLYVSFAYLDNRYLDNTSLLVRFVAGNPRMCSVAYVTHSIIMTLGQAVIYILNKHI